MHPCFHETFIVYSRKQLNGIEALKQIRRTSTVPVIVLDQVTYIRLSHSAYHNEYN